MKSRGFLLPLLIALAALLLPSVLLSAREMKSLTTVDGMSDLLVNTIYKDPRGYVWIGTGSGLDRFDGNHIRQFRFPADEYGANRVNAIIRSKNGDIYAGTHQGLFRSERGLSDLTRLFPDKINSAVNALAFGGKNTLYIGTRQGLFIYDTANEELKQRLLQQDALARDNEVTALLPYAGTGLWILSLNHLYFLDFKSGRISDYKSPSPWPMMHMALSGNTLHIGTQGGGVLSFDIITKRFGPAISIGNNIVTGISASTLHPGELHISTDGDGIFRYSIASRSVTEHLSASTPAQEGGLDSNSVYSLLVDEDGILWIGYYQNGLAYTPHYSNIFDVFAAPGLLDTRNMAVRALAVDGKRKLIGTRNGLYFIDEATNRSAAFKRPQIASDLIFSITPSPDKSTYYIGTYNGGMYRFNPSTLALTPFDGGVDGLSSGTVFDVEFDREGTMWVASSLGLIGYRHDKPVHHFTAANSQLPDGNVYEIFFDSTGRGWVCTENGMAIWDGKSLHTDNFPKGFIDKVKIRNVFEDSEGDLYFSPDRGDVFRSNHALTEFGPIEDASGAHGQTTTFTIEDSDGSLWFGTENGLSRYDRRGNFNMFNNADGLPNLVFTLCKPVIDSQGDLWMGNTAGLVRLDYERLKNELAIPRRPLEVSAIFVNGRDVTSRLDRSRDIPLFRLEGQENEVMLHISNLAYIPSRYQQLEYRLEGVDESWRPLHGDQPIHYYDLPGGERRFTVRYAGNADTEVSILISRPQRCSWEIAVIAVLIVLLGGAGIAIWRHRQAVREAREEREAEQREAATAAETPEENQSYRTSRISDEECKRILRILDRIMAEEKPYKNADLKSSDLARMAGTSSHALSYLFNQYLKRSYYDYVNHYRVEEFKRLASTVDRSRYTLTAMSEMCGFSSRASFFRHFKAITGITPAEYLKQNPD